MDPDGQLQSAATPDASSTRRRSRLGRPRVPFRHHDDGPPSAIVQAEMSISRHLVELRNRLVISALSLVPGTVLGFVFSGSIIHILDMQVAIVTGVIVGMPVILFEFWRFISPGLTPSERATARPWVPLALIFFVLGVGVAYFILPYAAGFLFTFQTQDIQLMLSAESYLGFITILFLAFGLVMEFPIILVLLSKVGVVTSKGLRKSRRMAILGIVIVSEVITPGADLVSPIVMAVTLYGLYEVSIILIRLGGR
jgi:sec-independent protein translocase protein TatC